MLFNTLLQKDAFKNANGYIDAITCLHESNVVVAVTAASVACPNVVRSTYTEFVVYVKTEPYQMYGDITLPVNTGIGCIQSVSVLCAWVCWCCQAASFREGWGVFRDRKPLV
jgi:hypothetical protein